VSEAGATLHAGGDRHNKAVQPPKNLVKSAGGWEANDSDSDESPYTALQL